MHVDQGTTDNCAIEIGEVMIVWFNQNQGFVLSVLTAVYVIATLIILCFMSHSNRIAARSIEISQRLHHEQTRPYVEFDIVYRDSSIYAELQNHGKTAAFDVHVSLEPQLNSIGGKRVSTLLRNTIGMLAPGREISDFIDVSHQFHEQNQLQFSGTVTYRDTSGENYQEDVNLDLQYYKETLTVARRDVGQELERMREELQRINQTLTKPPSGATAG